MTLPTLARERILRVFPERTRATPDDDMVRVGLPGLFDRDLDIDLVKISVVFKWQIPLAEKMFRAWSDFYPAEIGGVAMGDPGGQFEPGMFLKKGYVITSRGCPNKCWFCEAWKREGKIRELEVRPGNNVLDNNLLACSDNHIRAVFAMLKCQRGVEFTGGLEAARLKDWHVKELAEIKPIQMFFAYDTPDDLEPLREAGKKLAPVFGQPELRCYVLCGFKGDTVDKAQKRMLETMQAGFMPAAMFYQGSGIPAIKNEWQGFVRHYYRPAIMRKEMAEAAL